MKEKELKATVACSTRLDDGGWREMKRGGKKPTFFLPTITYSLYFPVHFSLHLPKYLNVWKRLFPYKMVSPILGEGKAPGTGFYNLEPTVTKHHNFLTTL